jgi:hypothetical protein
MITAPGTMALERGEHSEAATEHGSGLLKRKIIGYREDVLLMSTDVL